MKKNELPTNVAHFSEPTEELSSHPLFKQLNEQFDEACVAMVQP